MNMFLIQALAFTTFYFPLINCSMFEKRFFFDFYWIYIFQLLQKDSSWCQICGTSDKMGSRGGCDEAQELLLTELWLESPLNLTPDEDISRSRNLTVSRNDQNHSSQSLLCCDGWREVSQEDEWDHYNFQELGWETWNQTNHVLCWEQLWERLSCSVQLHQLSFNGILSKSNY